jgi:hypothetical protein
LGAEHGRRPPKKKPSEKPPEPCKHSAGDHCCVCGECCWCRHALALGRDPRNGGLAFVWHCRSGETNVIALGGIRR